LGKELKKLPEIYIIVPARGKENQMTVTEAIKAVQTSCNDPYAKAYANAAMESALQYGQHGLKVQCLYIVTNLTHWRGELAKQVRTVLREYAKSPEKTE
jgi:hypothetical protein